MKKVVLPLLLSCTLSFASCSSIEKIQSADNSVSSGVIVSADSGIIGKWKPLKATVNGEEDPFFTMDEDICGPTVVEFTQTGELNFNGFDTYTTDEGTECTPNNHTGTYETDGNGITLKSGDQASTGTYEIKENQLTIEMRMDHGGTELVRIETYQRL